MGEWHLKLSYANTRYGSYLALQMNLVRYGMEFLPYVYIRLLSLSIGI